MLEAWRNTVIDKSVISFKNIFFWLSYERVNKKLSNSQESFVYVIFTPKHIICTHTHPVLLVLFASSSSFSAWPLPFLSCSSRDDTRVTNSLSSLSSRFGFRGVEFGVASWRRDCRLSTRACERESCICRSSTFCCRDGASPPALLPAPRPDHHWDVPPRHDRDVHSSRSSNSVQGWRKWCQEPVSSLDTSENL